MRRAIASVFMMMLALFVCMGVVAQERSWEELIARYKAIREQTQKQHDYSKTVEAIDIAKEVLQVAEKQFGSDDPRLAESLYYLAEEYNIGIDYAQAESLYKRALAVYDKANKKQTLEYARVLIGLGTLYSLQSKYDQGLANYQRALEIIEKLPQPDTIALAQLLV